MLISIAIPCYQSEKNLEAVVEEIKDEFAKRPKYDYQIILVCDGSPDRTEDIIRRLCTEDSKIVGVLLSRNFSQPNAKMAALHYVKGEVLVYMDDDGQHPAKYIFDLVRKIDGGYDVVYADFEIKKQPKMKQVFSNVNGKLEEKLKVKPKGIKTSSFIAYSKFAVDQLKKYNSPSPSARNYLYGITTKFANVKCIQRERLTGRSGYRFKQLLSLASIDYINFSVVPLRIIDCVGLISAIIGFVFGVYLILKKIFNPQVSPGYTSIISVVLFLGGLILLSLGLVGEYIAKVYMDLSNKPQYVIREVIASDNNRKERIE